MRPDGRPLSTGRSTQALTPQIQAKNITAVYRLIVEGNDSGSKEEEGAKKKVSWEDAGGQEQREEDEDTPLIED